MLLPYAILLLFCTAAFKLLQQLRRLQIMWSQLEAVHADPLICLPQTGCTLQLQIAREAWE